MNIRKAWLLMGGVGGALANWILISGSWDDSKLWDDTQTWQDS